MQAVQRCLSKRKDTNFKANHNLGNGLCRCSADVCLSAKIRILKQITTGKNNDIIFTGCLSKRKDTNFKANHNRFMDDIERAVRCLSKRKDTNFKANHNRPCH